MKNKKLIKNENKSSISQASSYEEIGEFWDSHSLADYWDQTESVNFEINPHAKGIIYYGIDLELAEKINLIANHKGISGENLLIEWVKDKLKQEQIA
jgi:hypothetical protein